MSLDSESDVHGIHPERDRLPVIPVMAARLIDKCVLRHKGDVLDILCEHQSARSYPPARCAQT